MLKQGLSSATGIYIEREEKTTTLQRGLGMAFAQGSAKIGVS